MPGYPARNRRGVRRLPQKQIYLAPDQGEDGKNNFLNPRVAKLIENLFNVGIGRMVKRKGKDLYFTNGTTPISEFSSKYKTENNIEYDIFAQGTGLYFRHKTSGAIIPIKTNFTNPITSGIKYGTYFYTCNGKTGEKVGYTDGIADLGFDNLSGGLAVGRTITGGTSNANAEIYDITGTGTVLEDCEDTWFESVGTGVTSDVDSTDFITGTKSVIFTMDSTTGVEKIATEAMSSTDLSTKNYISLWIKSSIALNAGDLQLLLDNTASCASPLETLNIPKLAAGVWTHVFLKLANPGTDTAIISIGIKQAVDKGAFTLHIDDVETYPSITLELVDFDGNFQNNEQLIVKLDGVATGATMDADGVMNAGWVEIEDAPKCEILFVHQASLYAMNTDTNESEIKKSNQDSGTGIPFQEWIVPDPVEPASPNAFIYRNAGAGKAMGSVGDQVVGLFDSGKIGFRLQILDVGTAGLNQIVKFDFQREDFGGDAAISTSAGLFYVNEFGLWWNRGGGLGSNGQEQPFESKATNLIDEKLLAKLNFTDASLEFLPDTNKILVTCKNDAVFNNFILYFDIETQAVGRITGWNIKRFHRNGATLYGTDALNGNVYQLFEGYSDNGKDIFVSFESGWEDFGDGFQLKNSKNLFYEGKLFPDQMVTCSFNVAEKTGAITRDKLKYHWTLDGFLEEIVGIGDQGIGEGSTIASVEPMESVGHKKTKIRKYRKVAMKMSESSQMPLEINRFGLDVEFTGRNVKLNNLAQVEASTDQAFLTLDDEFLTID